MVMYKKSLVKIVLIIIAAVIMLALVYPAIRNVFLLYYMGVAQKNYWNEVEEVCSKNYMWFDEDEKFTLQFTSGTEGGVLKNQENGNSMYFIFTPDGIRFVDEADNTLSTTYGWGYWDYNEETQIFVLEINWFEEKGVFLKESMQLEEGTSISFYGKEIVQ